MRTKNLFASAVVLLFSAVGFAQGQRYCNPLPMPIGQGGNASGDVSVIEDGGKYYMYCSGGGAWVSDDLVDWTFHYVEGIPVAPDVAKYNGKFYLSGNDDNLYVSDSPLGPFKDLGPFKNTYAPEDGWIGGFDTKIFVDDDNTPYLYWPGRGVSGIYGVKLDPDDLTRFAEKPVHLFSFNPMHKWERYGERNEYGGVAWIEGPWIIKRNGIYYLEYSASGTQWKTYAEGYYTATSPLGPYSYAPNNPLLRKTEGLVTGTAHGSIIQGPDDEWYQFYTIVLSNPPGGRRIGMDKITFDEDGLMYCTVTDDPQPVPFATDVKTSVPVTINKVSQMDAHSKASSQQPDRPSAYAVDDFSGTIWFPEADDREPYIIVDLAPATNFDIVQLFEVDAMRVLFGNGRGNIWMSMNEPLPVYQYKLEVSMDGENFTTVVDQTKNSVSKDTLFDEFDPVTCRYVKFTITGWPEGKQLGVIDFTVFGRSSGHLPAETPIPGGGNM